MYLALICFPAICDNLSFNVSVSLSRRSYWVRCKDYTFNELGPALAPDHAPPEDSKTEPPAVHNHFYTTGRARSPFEPFTRALSL